MGGSKGNSDQLKLTRRKLFYLTGATGLSLAMQACGGHGNSNSSSVYGAPSTSTNVIWQNDPFRISTNRDASHNVVDFYGSKGSTDLPSAISYVTITTPKGVVVHYVLDSNSNPTQIIIENVGIIAATSVSLNLSQFAFNLFDGRSFSVAFDPTQGTVVNNAIASATTNSPLRSQKVATTRTTPTFGSLNLICPAGDAFAGVAYIYGSLAYNDNGTPQTDLVEVTEDANTPGLYTYTLPYYDDAHIGDAQAFRVAYVQQLNGFLSKISNGFSYFSDLVGDAVNGAAFYNVIATLEKWTTADTALLETLDTGLSLGSTIATLCAALPSAAAEAYVLAAQQFGGTITKAGTITFNVHAPGVPLVAKSIVYVGNNTAPAPTTIQLSECNNVQGIWKGTGTNQTGDGITWTFTLTVDSNNNASWSGLSSENVPAVYTGSISNTGNVLMIGTDQPSPDETREWSFSGQLTLSGSSMTGTLLAHSLDGLGTDTPESVNLTRTSSFTGNVIAVKPSSKALMNSKAIGSSKITASGQRS